MTYKGDQEPGAALTVSRAAPTPSLLPFEAWNLPLDVPASACTISRTVSENLTTPSRSRALAAQILTHAVLYVLENETGELLGYSQLWRHPNHAETWNKSFSNKMGRFCQGVGKGKNGVGKRVDGINNFYVIRFEDILKDRLNKVCYTSVVCEVRPGKKDPYRTRITICGTNVWYPGDVGINIESLELFNLMINSTLSRKSAKVVCFDIEHFYLSIPLGRPEYVKIKMPKIPQDLTDE